MSVIRSRVHAQDERGVTAVLFAVLLPVFLALGAIVISVGSWYTHARHLQTKVDAAALAGGDVWSFPCVETAPVGEPTSSQKIVDTARQFLGPHTEADGTQFTGTSKTNPPVYNPQVGGTGASKIHAVLNGSGYWTDSSSPADLSDGTTSVCASNHLDVKATEDDSANLFRYLPFFPDIKRKARVEIHQVEGLSGILPIAVRVPKPVSAAAVFYNESNGDILSVKYFCELQNPPPGFDVPTGLGAWTTYNTSDPTCNYTSWADVSVVDHTGVIIGVSYRPRCDAGAGITTNCLSDSFSTVNAFCQQGSGRVAQCFYANGAGASQSAISGLQYIRGYTNRTVQNGTKSGSPPVDWSSPPQVNGAWLDGPSANCGGSFTATSAYFNNPSTACTATLNANIAFGDALDTTKHPGARVNVKYGQVYGTDVPNGEEKCAVGGGQSFSGGNNKPNCDMTVNGSSGASQTVTLDPRFDNQGNPQTRHAFVIMIQLGKTTISTDGGATTTTCPNTPGPPCEWYYWDDSGPRNQGSWPSTKAGVDSLVFNNPIQRAFTGSPDVNGSIRWLRLVSADGGSCASNINIDAPAASQTVGSHCFYVDMGLKGSIAQDQGEPPFGFNTKGSQSGSVDCDPNLNQWKDETEQGCSPFYVANDFNPPQPTDPPCPWPDGTNRSWNQFTALSGAVWQPSPWPPYSCIISGGPPAAGQVDNGIKGRLFTPLPDKLLLNFRAGEQTPSNASGCPADSATDFVPGRDYWKDSYNASGGTYAFAKQGAHRNNLQDSDPRLVTLFMTAYNSFGGSGGGVYPIVAFGTFYITGWGTVNGSNGINVDDPCYYEAPVGTHSDPPPPDMVTVSGGSGAEYIWGHFITYRVPSASSIPDPNKLCNQADFMPCVAVLVQ